MTVTFQGERRGDAGLEPDEPAEAAGHLGLVELRQADRLRLRRDRVELRVEEVAGARRQARVAMPGDGAQDDGDAGAVALAAARDEGERRDGIDVREVEPPGEELLERRLGRSRDRRGAERADHGDADRAGVEATGVRADHVAVDAAVAALVDGAVAVDEEVVADVVPAVRLDVVDLDPAQDRGRLGGRVAVRPGRVVHAREADRRRVLAGRLRGSTRLPPRRCASTIGGAPAEATARSGILSSGLRTNDARRSRTAAGRCGSGCRSRGRPRWGCRRASRASPPPRGEPASGWSSSSAAASSHGPQSPDGRADAELHRAAAVPAHADEIEPAGRARERRASAVRAARRGT